MLTPLADQPLTSLLVGGTAPAAIIQYTFDSLQPRPSKFFRIDTFSGAYITNFSGVKLLTDDLLQSYF